MTLLILISGIRKLPGDVNIKIMLTWFLSGMWIENLGCINSEKLDRPMLAILEGITCIP